MVGQASMFLVPTSSAAYWLPVVGGLPLLTAAATTGHTGRSLLLLAAWVLHVPLYVWLGWGTLRLPLAHYLALLVIAAGMTWFAWAAWRVVSPLLPPQLRRLLPEVRDAREIAQSLRDAVQYGLQYADARHAIHLLAKNRNIRTHSTHDIGWLRRPGDTTTVYPEGAHAATTDCTGEFKRLFAALPPPKLRAQTEHDFGLNLTRSDLEAFPLYDPAARGNDCGEMPPSWHDLSFLLVPGLFTKSYPFYFSSLRATLQGLGLHVWGDLTTTFSEFDTDKSVAHNAAVLRMEVLAMVGERGRKHPTRRVVVLAHSKGAVDFAAALTLYPDELTPHIAAHVSLQGPHGGSPLVNDLMCTNLQRTVAISTLNTLSGAGAEALMDLTYPVRRSFHTDAGPYPAGAVPTVCLASWDKRRWGGALGQLGAWGGLTSMLQGPVLLAPAIAYIRARYGRRSDGAVCVDDAILPGTVFVQLDDMDHFGPGWRLFPASDGYDPARLCLALTRLALERAAMQ